MHINHPSTKVKTRRKSFNAAIESDCRSRQLHNTSDHLGIPSMSRRPRANTYEGNAQSISLGRTCTSGGPSIGQAWGGSSISTASTAPPQGSQIRIEGKDVPSQPTQLQVHVTQTFHAERKVNQGAKSRRSRGPVSLSQQTLCCVSSSRVLLVLREILQEHSDHSTPPKFEHFEDATTDPPITRQSLAELDIKPIAHNPKLRQDINFDRELHFRPNDSGQKGLVRRVAQAAYWDAIEIEVELYTIFGSGAQDAIAQSLPEDLSFEQVVLKSQKRLPIMFKTIREILENLVPPRDVTQVQEGLDADLIMQEINKQMFDITKKAEWLSGLLKKHCAPMRDSMIEEMLSIMQNRDSASISLGLCKLFTILEAMKLDIANHQIRHLRALLISDTTTFGRRYHTKRKMSQLQKSRAQKWFNDSRRRLEAREAPPMNTNGDFEVITQALVESIVPCSLQKLPDTFALDMDRIRDNRSEVLENIQVNLCYGVFEYLLVQDAPQDCLISLDTTRRIKETLRLIISDREVSLSVPHIAICIASQIQELIDGRVSAMNWRLIEEAEGLLLRRLDPRSWEFSQQRVDMEQELRTHTMAYGQRYFTVSAWDLFHALVPAAITPPLQLRPTVPPPPPPNEQHTVDSEIMCQSEYAHLAKKLAHIAILHFRLWGPLVYCDQVMNGSAPEGRPST